MSNHNTIDNLQGGSNAGQIKTLSNIGTTETTFSVIPNPVTGTGGGVAFVSFPDPETPGNGEAFKVRVSGTITTNATTNVAVKLYLGSDSNLSNDHVLVNTAAVNANTQTTQFLIDAVLQWDATSQTVHGLATTHINGTAAGPTGTTLVSSIASTSGLQFVPSAVFGASNAANAVSIRELAIDKI